MAYAHQARYQLAGPPDDRVARTIGAMLAFALDAGHHSPLVGQVAGAMARACGQLDTVCQARRLYQWLAERVRFKADPIGVEHLRHPDQLLAEIEAHGRAAADCDCQSTLAAAILVALGIPAEFVVDGLSAQGPLQHVYVAAKIGGRVYPMDAQHGTPFGVWPTAGRRKVWPVREPL